MGGELLGGQGQRNEKRNSHLHFLQHRGIIPLQLNDRTAYELA